MCLIAVTFTWREAGEFGHICAKKKPFHLLDYQPVQSLWKTPKIMALITAKFGESHWQNQLQKPSCKSDIHLKNSGWIQTKVVKITYFVHLIKAWLSTATGDFHLEMSPHSPYFGVICVVIFTRFQSCSEMDWPNKKLDNKHAGPFVTVEKVVLKLRLRIFC